MPEAFYLPVADAPAGRRFHATELTRGPWDPGAQHAGPPAALLGRALASLPSANGESGDRWLVGRITFELLRPVPIAEVEIEASVVRPGRSVELVEGSLSAGGAAVMRARGWRLRSDRIELPAALASTDPASPARDGGASPRGPGAGAARSFFDTGQAVGYHTAIEIRFERGSFVERGPATVWLRMRHPLVAGEGPSALERVLVAADAGNGVSATLDFRRYLFINVDLTVHLHRLPDGEWICLDAITIPEPTGLGLADSRLHDQRGPIGRALQTLLVRERRRRAGTRPRGGRKLIL